jgi:hypothetical protein
MLLLQVRCAELCQNPPDWGPWRSVLSEEQIPQVIVFSRKSPEKGERIDRASVRPRQVRYQAALRPDCIDYSRPLPIGNSRDALPGV